MLEGSLSQTGMHLVSFQIRGGVPFLVGDTGCQVGDFDMYSLPLLHLRRNQNDLVGHLVPWLGHILTLDAEKEIKFRAMYTHILKLCRLLIVPKNNPLLYFHETLNMYKYVDSNTDFTPPFLKNPITYTFKE